MAKELKTSLFTIYDEQGTETLVPAMKGEDGKSAYKIAVDNGFQGDEKAWLESLKGKDGTSGITTIDIERRSDGSFWTDPLTTGKVIIDMVNANKEVRLHFFDTITNTGDQLYSYETTINGVPYFRRNVVGIDKVERINIGVQYNGEIKFTQIPFRDNFLVVRTTETLNGETLKTITKSNAIKYGTVGQRTSWDNTNIKESDFAKMRVGGTILLQVLVSGDSKNTPAYIECIIRELTTTSCVAEGVALHMGKPVDLAELAIEVENKADRSIYLLDNSTVLQSDARDILTYADQYSGLIEFVSTSESKVAAVGYILSNLDGTYLITVTPDGTTTQWSKDGFAKHQIEARNLINEPMVDTDNLTVDVAGNPPVLYMLRNAKNKPGESGADGSMFVIPHSISKQLFLYTDMDNGKMWTRTVTGTADQHSFGVWEPLGGSSGEQVQPDWNQNDPQAPDYVKNRPFYGSEEYVFLEETEVSDGEIRVPDFYKTINPSTMYEVIIDGVSSFIESSYYSLAQTWVIGSSPVAPPFFGVIEGFLTGFLPPDSKKVSIKDADNGIAKLPIRFLPKLLMSPVGRHSASGGEFFNDYSLNKADVPYSHAEGQECSVVPISSYGEILGGHAEGTGCIAVPGQHVEGAYNIPDPLLPPFMNLPKYSHILGNGYKDQETGEWVRSNAHTVSYKSGIAWYQGRVLCGGADMDAPDAELNPDSVVIKSSTPGSAKRFRITVDDTGTIKAEEVMQANA